MNQIALILISLLSIAGYVNRAGDTIRFNDIKAAEINTKIGNYIRLSTDWVNMDLDSAMFYADKANALINSISSESVRFEVKKNLGNVYLAKGNFTSSLGYYFDAKKNVDNILNSKPNDYMAIMNQIDLLNKIGIAFFYQKNYDQALTYYNDAFKLLENAGALFPEIGSNYKLRLLNNFAAVHIQRSEYDLALSYYISALEESKQEGNDQLEASLCNNIGICYLEKKEYSHANYYFQHTLEIRENSKDKRGVAQVLNNIGKNYVYSRNINEAKKYYQKALRLGRETGNKESIIISLQSLSNIYDTLGDYKNALIALREYKSISDSLFNVESVNRIAQLEMQYKIDKQEKLFDLELKRRETEREKTELMYLTIGGTLFFLFLTAMLLIFLQKSKTRNVQLMKDKLELENKHILLEKQKLKEDLEYKTRELATNVMYLLRKNELITGIAQKLIKSKFDFKIENRKIIQEIIDELKLSQDNDVWSEFEAHFTQVHIDFYRRLNELFPNLSSNEKKLCAFLRLNMSTKDISAITYQSINSITVARSRLRKKLNIQGEEVDLINFLINL